MTTLNPLLQRSTHPQRKPYVRSHTFVDGVGPPPYSYFDETQDHLAAYFHAALGWKWSLDSDEFTEAARPGFLGRMRVLSATGGFAVAPKTTGLTFGEHGVWTGTGGTGAWGVEAQGGIVTLDGDFLMAAKVKLFAIRNLFGVQVAAGSQTVPPGCPGFACGGSGGGFWYATLGPTLYPIPAIPVVDNTWYRLQVSRVAGAIRWHINGQLAASVYFPDRLLAGGKWLECSRIVPGPAGEGFAIDAFHLLAERSNL